MFGDPLNKQFTQSLLDAARKVGEKTAADAKTAKEEKEKQESEDMIGQFDESIDRYPIAKAALADLRKQKTPKKRIDPKDPKSALSKAEREITKRFKAEETQLDEIDMFKRAWDEPGLKPGAKHQMALEYGERKSKEKFGKHGMSTFAGMDHADYHKSLALAADHALSSVSGDKNVAKETLSMHKAFHNGRFDYKPPSNSEVSDAINHVRTARTNNILGKPKKIQEIFGWGKKKDHNPNSMQSKMHAHEKERYYNMGAKHAKAGLPPRPPSTAHPDLVRQYHIGHEENS